MAEGDAEYRSLPFDEAVKFLRQKVNVPSPKWADILEGAHARAFTVAGATKEGMLTDFRAAIDKAIAQGTTLEAFRKDFDKIVSTYGWDYNGARGWRTRVIYSTNLTTAYQAGRFQQMTDPDVLRYRPYWQYKHADGVKHPRPEHLAWNDLVLDANDPWWKTHYPPNGWGCHCYVDALSDRDLGREEETNPDQAPAVDMQKRTLNTSAGPLEIDVPKGVDPGWGYNVGDAAFGRQLPEHVMEAARQNPEGVWQRLTQGDWQSAGRPRQLPADAPRAKPGPAAQDTADFAGIVARAIGGAQRALDLPDGSTVLIDAASLAAEAGADLGRARFAPLLPELLADPYEIWATFERHNATGQVVLRKRLVKVVSLGRNRGLLLVLNASGGMLESWTFVPNRPAYLQKQRVGQLLWARE